jgi:cytochrome c
VKFLLFGSGAGLALFASVAFAGAAAPAGDVSHGASVFARCAACHSISKTSIGGIGPNLAGVVGRKAGALPGYRYSTAMKNSGLVWNEATLARFLAAPSQVVPGTKMTFAGLSNPKDRADVIALLKNGPKK